MVIYQVGTVLFFIVLIGLLTKYALKNSDGRK